MKKLRLWGVQQPNNRAPRWESRALALASYSVPLLINIWGIFALEVIIQEQI